ncbi:MAG: TRAP transporter substrate-binding protein DctP [Myxococcales bacterium]|nr:TRAP transporter substrate-binding protein DctP [Myxococcales bacterium]
MLRILLTSSVLLVAVLLSGDSIRSEARAENAKAESAETSPNANPEPTAEPTHQLRIATLAPRQSDLGRAFQQLRKELKEVTNGQVNLKMYDGGVAGDEMTVVRKMRVGQLDGALLTSTGLGALVPQVLVLQAPGLITSYPALDDVRAKLGPDLVALFDKAGYELISWGDSGQVRIFSKHKVQHPNDLKNVRPWVWRGSPTMKAFVDAAGANGVTMGLPEVFSALQTGMVDTVIASSIGVLAFQWHTKLKTMTKPGGGIVVGAYVIKKERLSALPPAAQEHIRQSAKEHAEEFREGGRRLDAEASKALAGRLKSVNLWRNKEAWDAVQRDARNSLAGRLYSKSLMTRVQEIVGKNY